MSAAAMARTLWIIADDYGLGERHDAVMRELLAASAIDGVSVLVETCSRESADALAELWTPERRVGLHLNLTWSPRRDTPRPGRSGLLARSALGLGRSQAGEALGAQWHLFEALLGRRPDYIDGHEHCHAFPSVRPLVMELARTQDVAVRSMVPMAPPRGLKAGVIAALGRGVQREARRAGVRTNWRFGGVLPIDDPGRAAALLRGELEAAARLAASVADRGEVWVMTHPGDAADPVQIPGHPPRLRALEATLLSEGVGWSGGSAVPAGHLSGR